MLSNRSTQPVRPPAGYVGGKRNLAQRLVARIEKVPHRCYAEPFLGMGGVFLRRRQAPSSEVVNDISRDVATFFRILQRHYPQFIETLKFQLTGRAEFQRLVRTDPSTLTDLERAARFLYLQRTGYASKVVGRTFGVDVRGGARFNLLRLAPLLEDIHARLAGVTIECLPWAEFIARYDSAETLFYLDPPYWGCETDYGEGLFAREDFARLAEQLAGIQGRFILSINDVAPIRKLFGRFKIEPVATSYSIAGGGGGKAKELIISGR